MPKIVLFASGSGTNVENIVQYFQNNGGAEISCVFTNRKGAGVIGRCHKLDVPLLYFNKNAFETDVVLDVLTAMSPDLIVLAGFLLKVPKKLILAFPDKIINIHPALLPKHGGKGMYGDRVHQAVKDNGEHESGITIHYVNENYDEGAIILQEKVAVTENDSVTDIAKKVHALEYEHYPKTIANLLAKNG